MPSDLLLLVSQLTIATSVGILAVLATRRIVRAWFGPLLAYRLWLIVPLAALASLVPLPPGDDHVSVLMFPIGEIPFSPVVAPIARATGLSGSILLIAAWLAGVIACAAAVILEHRRALRAYGALTPSSIADTQVHRTGKPGAGPSLIGLFRTCLIVPADFETRFNPQEQDLVIEHERQHGRAGDPLVNGVTVLLRCLTWFNPLVHIAAMMLRVDQELACDAAVIARRPNDRRAYAEALLKTQLSSVPTQLGCHWPVRSAAVLFERVEMLSRETPRGVRWATGFALVFAIGVGASAAAWSLQPGGLNSASANMAAPIPAPSEEARFAAFAASDTDGDGRIDKAGYKQVLETLGFANLLESNFAQRDANRDGFVSREEYKTPLPAVRGVTAIRMDYEHGRIDGAGYLRVLEKLGYAHLQETNFATRDANLDGFVSAEEYRTSLPAAPGLTAIRIDGGQSEIFGFPERKSETDARGSPKPPDVGGAPF